MSSKQKISTFIPTQEIKKLPYETPYFLFNKQSLVGVVDKYTSGFAPGTEIYYAMKANSEKPVLAVLQELGCGFEVASKSELELLKELNVSPKKIIFGTAVKPASHIQEFFKYGVDRFAFDSDQELEKIAKFAPGSKVYARALVSDKANSVFTMSKKFGTDISNAIRLLKKTRDYGLVPYGISFNVGSQARNSAAWANGLNDLIEAMVELKKDGIVLEMVDIGGGFPWIYQQNNEIPNIEEIANAVNKAITQLPYPVKLFIEPGRGLVAGAYILVVGVFGKINRPSGHWLYIDAGTYNALLETMAYQGSIKYEILPIEEHAEKYEDYIVTGPTGDDLDVIDKSARLPKSISIGDKLAIIDVGAYSFTLTTPFNGFLKPPTYTI